MSEDRGNINNNSKNKKKYYGNKRNKYRNPKERTFRGKDETKGAITNTPKAGTEHKFDDYVGSTNDISWYNHNPQLIHDAAKIPFGNQLGRVIDMKSVEAWTDSSPGNYSKAIADFVVPGVCSIHMINTPGLAKDASDGVNIATALTFQKMRKELSTYATYAAADVMMYIMGIDSIYSQYANIARAFGIVNAYSAINLYTPDSLLMAGYGFSAAEIAGFKERMNNLRTRFNNLIYKASTLYLPVDFSIITRHAWLYSNYFMDNNSYKAQYYIHRMMGHHIIDETSDTNGTMARFRDQSVTIDGLLNDLDDCIEAYRNSDSMLKIAADMRRAFADHSAWKMAYIDENYIVLPSVDETVLSQIHNLTMLPTIIFDHFVNDTTGYNVGKLNIRQDVNHNIVLFNPEYRVDHADLATHMAEFWRCNLNAQTQILDFNSPEVTEDMVVEATRNTFVGVQNHNANTSAFMPLAIGADLCVGMSIWTKSGNTYTALAIPANVIEPGPVDLSTAEKMQLISALTKFNWAPKIAISFSTNSNPELVWQLDNYATVEVDVIGKLNNNIMCSMWSVPTLGL